MACGESITAHLRHVTIYLSPEESQRIYTGGIGAVLAGPVSNYQEVESDFYLSETSVPHQVYGRLCQALRRANGRVYYIVVSPNGAQQYYNQNYEPIAATPNEGARIFEHQALEESQNGGVSEFNTEVYTIYLSA
jgi:hypothetical protein